MYGGLHDSTGSSTSLEFVKNALEECLATHEHPAYQEPLSPTRLVKFEEKGCRLCLGEQLESNPTYVTLSHCWGSMEKQCEVFTLRRGNLNQLCHKIPMELLCKTFKDAIMVTRDLAYEYI